LIVVDANILAYTLIEGDKTAQALRLSTVDPEWRVPFICRYELTNLLATYVRAGGLAETSALRHHESFVALLSNIEVPVDPGASLHIAIRSSITAYDAEYIAVAESLNVLCVTEDVKLRRALPTRTRSLAQMLA
jgi:predicted nucleic acid-binding protein